jgi:hypothetical protein
MVKVRNAYLILDGDYKTMRSYERTQCRWMDNIKWDFRNKVWGSVIKIA